MSYELSQRVVPIRMGTCAQKLVLFLAAFHASPRGICHMTRSELAEAASCSVRTVDRATAFWTQRGLMWRTPTGALRVRIPKKGARG